jgi:hypothetical protein
MNKMTIKKIWNSKIALIISTIIILSCININAEKNIIKKSGETIFVDDDGGADYTKIQDAIDNATNGDTIFVFNGTYREENITINISINLIGENKFSTIIDGLQGKNTVNVLSENVVISGFTVTNSSNKYKRWASAGIRLTGSNNKIFGNIISNNLQGIFGMAVTNISIYDNIFLKDGITFSLYDYGNYRTPYDEKYFIHNIYNNTVNDKKIYYFLNENNIKVPIDAGQVIAVNCFNLEIKNLILSNTDFPVIFINCKNSKIEKSEITNNDGIVWFIHSKRNVISRCEISNNFEGIVLDTESLFNIVKFNNIKNNFYYGIIIEDKSNFNLIYRNNFIGNNPNYPNYSAAFIECIKNFWKKNYWNRGRVLPKIILGFDDNAEPKWINIDWTPALIPNLI